MTEDPTKISAQPPPETPAKNGNRGRSKGEKLFDWLAYGGFAGVATFILSMPMGYWARYSKSGQETIKLAAKHLKPFGLSEHVAEDVVMNTALMQGGNVMLLGVKGMENNKEQLVNKFNDHFGEDGDFSMEKEAKQSWSNLIVSRLLLAWTPVFLALRGAGMLLGKERFNDFEKKFAKHMVCDPLGKPTHINGAETLTFKLGRIAAIDLFATAAAASLLYLGSHFLARKKHGHGDGAAPQATPETLPAAAATVSADAIPAQPEPAQNDNCARCKYIPRPLRQPDSRVELAAPPSPDAAALALVPQP